VTVTIAFRLLVRANVDVEIVYYRRVSLVQEVRTCPYVEERSIWRASGTGAACG